MAKTDSAKYRPDIDGLRALAILPVLLFHAEVGCPGGYIGVDIFFVISGFLISSLILKELGEGTFSLANFWERRIRRILPAMVVVVLATIVTGWFMFLPQDFKTIGESAVAQAFLLPNFYFWHQSGYFSPDWDTMPLLHTWSLAVEEQFYVLFPLFLILLYRGKRHWATQGIAGLAIVSFILSVIGTYKMPTGTYYMLPTRAWELMVGAWLASTQGKLSGPKLVTEISGWLGAGLIVFAICCYSAETQFPGLAAVPPCLGAGLLIYSSQSGLSSAGRVLALKPVVFIGLISYSLYLWHWPLLVFAKYLALDTQWQRVWYRVVPLLASFGLAILSWKFVETPFRRRMILQRRPAIFAFAGVSLGTVLILGLAIFAQRGFPARYSPQALHYAASWQDWAFNNEISLEQAVAGQFGELGFGDTNKPVKLVIWGDSHAMSVTPALDTLCRQYGWRGVEATHSSTAPVLNYVSTGEFGLKENSPAFTRAVLDFIRKNHVPNVILTAYWSSFHISDSFKSNLLATVRAVMDTGAKVYVLEDVPVPGYNVPRLAAYGAAHHEDLDALGTTPEKYREVNHELAGTFQQISQMGATVLDPTGYFLNRKGLYGVVKDNDVLYRDEHHLTVEGAEELCPLFEPIFKPAEDK